MIIPIRPPSNNTTLQNQCGNSIENVEWVMIELNGELLKPLDYGNETTSCTTKNGDENGSSHKSSDRLELGSVKFDSAVSLQTQSILFLYYSSFRHSVCVLTIHQCIKLPKR
jgi:hypothetical protein